MTSYSFSPQYVQKRMRDQKIQSSVAALIVAIALPIALFFTPLSAQPTPVHWFISIGISGFVLGLIFSLRASLKSFLRMQITLEADRITATHYGKLITVHRSRVRQIIDNPDVGIRIIASNPSSEIIAPRELRHYESLRSTLITWLPPTPESRLTRWLPVIYALVALLALTVFIALGLPDRYLMQWRPILITVACLLFLTLIVSELVAGKATLGEGSPASREDSPWFYWLFIAIQSLTQIGFVYYIFNDLLRYDTKTIMATFVLIAVWLSIGTFILIKRLRRSSQ